MFHRLLMIDINPLTSMKSENARLRGCNCDYEWVERGGELNAPANPTSFNLVLVVSWATHEPVTVFVFLLAVFSFLPHSSAVPPIPFPAPLFSKTTSQWVQMLLHCLYNVKSLL